MPKSKGSGKGLNKPITIRLPPEEEMFYRRKANENGMSLSAYLAKMLVAGVSAENVQDVEIRLRSVIASIPASLQGGGLQPLPENVRMSIYTSEYMLSAIVEARSPSDLYAAQDKAKARITKERGGL